MKSLREFFATPTGQLIAVGLIALLAGGVAYWRKQARPTVEAVPPAASRPTTAPSLRTFLREGTPFPQKPAEAPAMAEKEATPSSPAPKPKPSALPLSLLPRSELPAPDTKIRAPYGRLIPCETVLTLESNRLETPVIGLVTEEVWHAGKLIIPAGAEVHGRASTDRARERLAAEGTWRIVWRSPALDNGAELTVRGLALDRERDPATGAWGLHDGSAGLRGEVLRTNDWQAVQLFAASFLGSATAALQDTRTAAGVLGETLTPAATARNATLAGTGAVLRDYAGQIRQAVERDGLYVRVPAGKAFYLYVTEPLARETRANPSDYAP